MIKVNLIEQKKPLKIPVFLGVDITKINYKFLIVAIIINYLPGCHIYPRFNSMQENSRKEIGILEKENKEFKKTLDKNKDVDKKIQEFDEKIRDLKLKTKQIEKILKVKTNPKPALERIAKDIPEDLWLTQILLENSTEISIQGMSYSFRSISNFLSLVNDSKYYNRSLGVVDSKTLMETHRGKKRRVESFVIKGKINLQGGAR